MAINFWGIKSTLFFGDFMQTSNFILEIIYPWNYLCDKVLSVTLIEAIHYPLFFHRQKLRAFDNW